MTFFVLRRALPHPVQRQTTWAEVSDVILVGNTARKRSHHFPAKFFKFKVDWATKQDSERLPLVLFYNLMVAGAFSSWDRFAIDKLRIPSAVLHRGR